MSDHLAAFCTKVKTFPQMPVKQPGLSRVGSHVCVEFPISLRSESPERRLSPRPRHFRSSSGPDVHSSDVLLWTTPGRSLPVHGSAFYPHGRTVLLTSVCRYKECLSPYRQYLRSRSPYSQLMQLSIPCRNR